MLKHVLRLLVAMILLVAVDIVGNAGSAVRVVLYRFTAHSLDTRWREQK